MALRSLAALHAARGAPLLTGELIKFPPLGYALGKHASF